MLRGMDGNLRRIAILRVLHLGDLLLAVPAWRTLREAFPTAELTLIGLPWAHDFVGRFGYIDRLVEFPGYPGMLEVEPNEDRLRDFLATAQAYRYDLTMQMHGSGEQSAAFVAELGGRYSIGYAPLEAQQPRLTHALAYPSDLPEVYRNLRLVEQVTDLRCDPRLEFPLRPEDHAALRALPEVASLSSGTRIVGIHPGARPSARRWRPERFAAVADALAREDGAAVVILGGPGEERIASRVVEHMATPTINVAGRTSLGAMAALIARMALFIGNDSGPAHVAAALNTPSITLFGPADPARWAPLNRQRHRIIYKQVECSPCGFWDCPIDHRCLERIHPDEVLAVARELLWEAKVV